MVIRTQKAGRNTQKENLSVFNALIMTFCSPRLRFSTVVLIRFVRVFGSTVKDGFGRPNSLKTVLVFSYFAT